MADLSKPVVLTETVTNRPVEVQDAFEIHWKLDLVLNLSKTNTQTISISSS